MSIKYDCWFCDCGRIHTMNYSEYDWLSEKHEKRALIRVCQNCGATRMIWLSEYYDEFTDNMGFCINGSDVEDGTILSTNGNNDEYRIFFSRGIKIPMKSGGYANWKFNHGYVNSDYLKDTLGTTYIPTALQKDPLCTTVDTERLIREVNDDDILQSISGYLVGIDWKGTKYEKQI